MSKTTKQVSAFRQISAAIDHFDKQNYECAITLAAAGEGQIVERSTGHLFRVIRAKFSGQAANEVITWLKHSSGPDEKEITEQEVVATIIRGIQKYVGTYEMSHPKFETFSKMVHGERIYDKAADRKGEEVASTVSGFCVNRRRVSATLYRSSTLPGGCAIST